MRHRIRLLVLWLHSNPFIVDVIVGIELAIFVRIFFTKGLCLAWFQNNPWQVVVVGVIVLFRTPLIRILEEFPGLLRRSYVRYGSDVRDPLPDAVSVKGFFPNDALEDGDKFKSFASGEGTSFQEHRAFQMLREEYGVEIRERMSIGLSHYYFDGVMEYRGMLYGIEVKGVVSNTRFELLFRNVQKAYDGFTEDQKRRFVLLVCMVGGASSQDKAPLRDLVDQQKYPVILKFYPRRDQK